jgi:4-oxalocrotonate tautomerase
VGQDFRTLWQLPRASRQRQDELSGFHDSLLGRNWACGCLLRAGRVGRRVTQNCHTKESRIPLINVKVIEGVFSAEQKSQIIQRLTNAMVEIEGEAMRSVTWTVVEEVKSGDWGIAGKPLTTADVRALAASRPVKTA